MADISRRGFLKSTAAIAAITGATSTPQRLWAETGREGAALEAGVAVRDITPGPGIPMWGYSNRLEPATGALDPLEAKALVLGVGERRVAIVVCDLGRVPMDDVCGRIREAAQAWDIDDVVFSATHTHGGPAVEVEGPHLETIESGIRDAIEEAVGRLQPVRMAVTRTPIDIAHNRRYIVDGRCYMLWRNASRMPTHPVDPEAVVVSLEGLDGERVATLVHYACHPVVLSFDNLRYSADWSGEMCRVVAEHTGAPCLFLQGGCGDINPYLDKTPLDAGGVDSMRETGRAAAGPVLLALRGLTPETGPKPGLAFGRIDVPVGTRWDFSKPEVRAFFEQRYGRLFDRYMARLGPDLALPASALVVNGELALAFFPGEFFVQFQLEMKQTTPVPTTLLCGYADEFHLYFPTVKDAAVGGYGGSSATYVGLGAGDRMVAEAQILVGRLTGQLRDAPAEADFELTDYPPPASD